MSIYHVRIFVSGTLHSVSVEADDFKIGGQG